MLGYGNHSLYVAYANISVRGKDKSQEPVYAGRKDYMRRDSSVALKNRATSPPCHSEQAVFDGNTNTKPLRIIM